MGEQLRPWLAPQPFGSSPFRRTTRTLISRGCESRVRAHGDAQPPAVRAGWAPLVPGHQPGQGVCLCHSTHSWRSPVAQGWWEWR